LAPVFKNKPLDSDLQKINAPLFSVVHVRCERDVVRWCSQSVVVWRQIWEIRKLSKVFTAYSSNNFSADNWYYDNMSVCNLDVGQFGVYAIHT